MAKNSQPDTLPPVAYAHAIDLLREKLKGKRSDSDLDQLVRVILAACRSAEAYIAVGGGDENAALRRNDTEAKDSLPDQIKAIRALSSFARKHGRQSGFALASAGFSGRGERDEGKALSVAFIDLLRDYEKGLGITARKEGPFTHRYSYANLIFQKPIDGVKKLPMVSTCLLFHLVFLLRNFTGPQQAFARYQTGEPMPSHGSPNYSVAVEFVNVATGGDVLDEGAALRKLIRENPGLGLGRWP